MTARPFGDLVTVQIRDGARKRVRRRTINRTAYRRAYARALYALRDSHEAEFHELLEHLIVEAQAEGHAS